MSSAGVYHIDVETILRPSRWGLLLGLLIFFGFGSLPLYAIIQRGDLSSLIFLVMAIVFAGLILVGSRSWVALKPGCIQQHSPFSKRHSWRFEAGQIDAWSEISMIESQWLMMNAEEREDERELNGEPDLQSPHTKNYRYILFRLSESGEVIQVAIGYSWGKLGEPVRQWFQEHVGDPLTDEDGLHWQIDKARDRRCFVPRALKEIELSDR